MIENDTYENFAYKVGTGEINNQKIIDILNKEQLEETVRKNESHRRSIRRKTIILLLQ